MVATVFCVAALIACNGKADGDAVILYEHTAVKTYNLKDAFFSEKAANENMVNLLMRELK